MKKFSKIIVWAMLSIMMQCAGLLYLDKVIFKESSEFTIEKVDIITKSVEANVSIPTNAEKIEVSFDGKFITYYEDGKFMLVDTKTSAITEILADTEILFTGWIPTANSIMVAEKVTNKSEGTVVNIKTYNAKNKNENLIKIVDSSNNEVPVCKYQSGMEVDNIVSSVQTGTKYVSVSRNGNSSTIYRIDMNDKIGQLDNKVTELGSIKAFLSTDILIYEDSLNNSFYRYTAGSRKKISFDNANNLVILGAISVDRIYTIYMGELSEDKIVKIIYGEDGTATSTWKTEILEKPKDIKDITITNKNQILVNDSREGKVKNITTGDTVTYDGTFITVNDKVVCSSDNGKIYLKSVTDVDKKQEVTSKK